MSDRAAAKKPLAVLASLALAVPLLAGLSPAAADEPAAGADNLARSATATASWTSDHASVDAVNDGDLGGGDWASWPIVGETWIQLSWDAPVSLDRAAVQFAADQADETRAGIIPPRGWELQYQTDAGWQPVSTTSAYDRTRDTLIDIAFTPVTTSALRLVMQAWGDQDFEGSSAVREFQAFASSSASSGCRTTSSKYPWGTFPWRTWTPTETGTYAPNKGTPFEARLITAYNRDTDVSSELVVLEDREGCRSAYPARSFSGADREQITEARAAHPPVADPESYRVQYDDNLVSRQQVDSGETNLYETQHFAIFYGNRTDAFSYTWMANRGTAWDDAIETLGRWMEESWYLVRDHTGAPMPWADSSDKQKVNIYICGTGLPWFDDGGDCGASASGNGIWVSAPYILDGSSTMTHEFAHTLQGLTGGFDRGHPGVGNIWEGHANWLSATTGSYFNIWYYQNLENGPTWQTNYYGFFPLLLALQGDDDTSDYVWRAWRENLRDPDNATQEEFFETVVRLGQQDGVYPDGFASFADDLGWYGARLAADDFVQGPEFLGQRRFWQEASRYVGLVPDNGADTYASPPERSLWQFGTHIIPLKTEGGQVSVALAGDARKSTSAWRYALVHVGADGKPRYSPLGVDDADRTGSTVWLDASAPGEYYLAVTATPYEFERIGGETAPTDATEFPYTVQLTGARPALPGTGTCLGPYTVGGANLNWKTNGNFTYDQGCADEGPRVSITGEPADAAVDGAESASFTVAASGVETPRLQWQTLSPGQSQWQDVAGATGSTLTLPAGQPDGIRVRALAVGKADTVIASRAALLTVR